MDSWGQLNPTSPGKKSSNRVYQSVSDSIIVSLLCLKITEKVSLNIASEVGNVLHFECFEWKKFIENANQWWVLENLKRVVKQCYQIGEF